MFCTPETFITFVHHKIHFKTSFLFGIFALLKEYGYILAETWSFLRDFWLFLISELCFVNVLFYFFSSNFTSLAFQKERIRLIKLAKFWFLPEIYFIWKFKLIQHKNKLNAKLNASTGKLSFLNASFFFKSLKCLVKKHNSFMEEFYEPQMFFSHPQGYIPPHWGQQMPPLPLSYLASFLRNLFLSVISSNKLISAQLTSASSWK